MTLPTLTTQKQIIEQIRQAQLARPSFLVQMRERQNQGLKIANNIAQRLKQEFGVQKVVLFGSLLNPEYMTENSDIDLAVWGLPVNRLYHVGAVMETGHNFPIDIIPAEQAKPYIQQEILQGIEL
jgi:predicted nucleotidyltransferase